jgi:hypothetical protein
MVRSKLRSAAALMLLSAAAQAPAALAAHRAYESTRAPYRPVARLRVTYSGSGTYGTVYHSEPPNPGGNHDTDDAHDSSSQSWRLTFSRRLVVRPCAGTNRCPAIADLTGARGATFATGRIDHTHIDGLYPDLNASVNCRVSSATPRGAPLQATLQVQTVPHSRAVAVTALTPVSEALLMLPTECPGQGDSLDGLANNYFTPGFSFAAGYGPERWFTSRTVEVPARVLHRAARVTIRFGATAAGRPPRGCAVPEPSYERCTTGGSWGGTVTLTRTAGSPSP